MCDIEPFSFFFVLKWFDRNYLQLYRIHKLAKYLEDFSIDVGGLWYTYKTEEKMLAQVLWRCHFQENVHEDLESGKVDFLREKRKYRKSLAT